MPAVAGRVVLDLRRRTVGFDPAAGLVSSTQRAAGAGDLPGLAGTLKEVGDPSQISAATAIALLDPEAIAGETAAPLAGPEVEVPSATRILAPSDTQLL